jgi:hypothetical protein
LEKFSPLPIVRSKDYEIQVDVRSSDNVRGPGEIKRPFIKKDLKRSFIILQGNLIKKRLLTDRILRRKKQTVLLSKVEYLCRKKYLFSGVFFVKKYAASV